MVSHQNRMRQVLHFAHSQKKSLGHFALPNFSTAVMTANQQKKTLHYETRTIPSTFLPLINTFYHQVEPLPEKNWIQPQLPSPFDPFFSGQVTGPSRLSDKHMGPR